MRQGYVTMMSLGKYGRWANQFFQIAGVMGIAKKNNLAPVFPEWKNHDGRNFETELDIDVQRHFVYELPRIPEGTQWKPERPVGWGYNDVTLPSGNWNLSGHFQSPRYFANCIDTVRHYFRMKDEPPLNDYVAIHFRGQDYDDAAGWHPRMTMAYYGPAMARFPGAKFLVFTDDMESAKQIFGDSIEYSGLDYIGDFRLMKTCQPAGTTVRTPDGDVPIETLREGARVISYSGTFEYHPQVGVRPKMIGGIKSGHGVPPGRVIKRFAEKPYSGDLVKVTTVSGKTSVYTPDHHCLVRDLTSDREIVIRACNLVDGMKVLDADLYLEAGGQGVQPQAWTEISIAKEPYRGLVYSMDIAVNHTYIGDGIVTHNCSHFIIANSSYSAMAALLGEAPDKRVVAPRPWFGTAAGISGDDIYDDGWEIVTWQ